MLLEQARDSGRLTLLEHHSMIDLLVQPRPKQRAHATDPIRCYGAYVLNTVKDQIETVTARAVVLATGGSGMVYLHTTNPSIATGDGLIAAWRAGATVGNLEFFQFHPTSYYEPEDSGTKPRALITEALRGYGAILRNRRGDRFMDRYDARLELAPRDIVARAIDAEMKKLGDPFVVLDCTHLRRDDLRRDFPNIDRICQDHGLDFTTEPIPVVPAAHYQCGGVLTDLQTRTNIQGLFAVGEVAMTGLHGANRLASNSLLEAVVFAHQAARSCEEWLKTAPPIPAADDWSAEGTVNQEEWVLVEHNRDAIRKTMWDYVGIVRSTFRLERAQRRMTLFKQEIDEFYRKTRVNAPLVELRNLVLLADLIIRMAINRRESRGLHFMTDFPQPGHEKPQDTLLNKYPAA